MRVLPQPGDIVTVRDEWCDEVIGVVDSDGVAERVHTVKSGTMGICIDISKPIYPRPCDDEGKHAYDIHVLVNGMIVTFWDEEVEPV